MKEIRANKAINEIIATEESYNLSLSLLKKVFEDKNLAQGNFLLQQLIPLIMLLKIISDDLLKNVHDGIESKSLEARNAYRRQRINLIANFFDTYLRYTKTYEKFMGENQNNTDLFAKYNSLLAKLSSTQNLSALLIQPIQRGPRYSLLIKEALSSAVHLDAQNLTELEALKNKISQYLKEINEILSPAVNPVPGYQFGDISRAVFSFFSSDKTTKDSSHEKGYKFGDFTRSILSGHAFANFLDTTSEEDFHRINSL